MTPNDLLFSFDAATVIRHGGGPVLRDFTWAARAGETWAVVGPTGCGKTTLAELLIGRHRVETGSLSWPLLDRLRAAGYPGQWTPLEDGIHRYITQYLAPGALYR